MATTTQISAPGLSSSGRTRTGGQIVTRVPAISAEAGVRPTATLFMGNRASEPSGPIQIHKSRQGGGRGRTGRGGRGRRDDGTSDEGETRRERRGGLCYGATRELRHSFRRANT